MKKKTYKRHGGSSLVLCCIADDVDNCAVFCIFAALGRRCAVLTGYQGLITFHDTLTFNLITPAVRLVCSGREGATEGGKNESETTPSHLLEAPDE